jgi:type II secretory ATPase GspE/PulE/Tfp pilus assembly ATPase PilB-like protein
MADPAKKGALGEILSASQIISESDILTALEEQRRSGCRFGEALVNLGAVTQEDIDWALSSQLDIPFIRLKREMIDPHALALIPAEVAREFSCIPLFLAGGELNVALADPLNRPAIAEIELRTGLHVNISVALMREIRQLIEECYGPTSSASLGFESASFSEKVLEAVNSDMSGGKLLDCLLIFMLRNRLSSFSLQPFDERVLVRGSLGGVTRAIGTLSPAHYPAVVATLRQLASLRQSAGLAGGGSFSFSYRSRQHVFELALLKGCDGEYATIRQQVSAAFPGRLSDLHLTQEQSAAFLRLAHAGPGITFVASRSIRERSRCMDLLLEEAGCEEKNVIILGDGAGRLKRRFPVIPLPFAALERARLIRDSLDHDPDILAIEDASEGLPFGAACRAAMAGKQVLAGLDLRGTRTVLRQLLLCRQNDMFLQLCISGLVSIESVRILCPECRLEYVPTAEVLAAMALEQAPPAFYRSNGCDHCGQSGFRERRFLLDLLSFDEEFLQLFGQGGELDDLERYLAVKGHRGIAGEGLRLLGEGELSPDEYVALLAHF